VTRVAHHFATYRRPKQQEHPTTPEKKEEASAWIVIPASKTAVSLITRSYVAAIRIHGIS
jgi:hypothetical protein